MKVAFIGLGFMGAQQAESLARAGFDLTVFDATPGARERFVGKARIATDSADAVSEADILCLCVRDDEQVNDVLLGAGGALAALPAGATVLIHSTIRPDTVIDLAGRGLMHGVTVIDAPVSRSEDEGDGRFVVCMVGGTVEAVEKARPILDAFSTRIVHAGPVGAAQALKISNNMVTWVHIVIGRLAYQLATKAGVSEELLEQVMRDNGNLTPTVEKLSNTLRAYPPGTRGQVDAMMLNQSGIGEKDLALAIEFADACGCDAAIAAAARAQVVSALTRA